MLKIKKTIIKKFRDSQKRYQQKHRQELLQTVLDLTNAFAADNDKILSVWNFKDFVQCKIEQLKKEQEC